MTTQDRLVQTQKLASLGQLTAANRSPIDSRLCWLRPGHLRFREPPPCVSQAHYGAGHRMGVIAALAVKLSEDTAPSPPSSDAVVAMSL